MRFVRKTNKAMKWIFGVICLTASLAAVSATFCRSSDDCKDGFCCVGLTLSQMLGRGLCLRLTRERRACSEPESQSDYFDGKFLRYCPCLEGLVCEPNKPGITDPEKRRKALRCQKPTATSTGPDVTTASNIVTDGEITTRGEIVTDGEITTRGEIVTDGETVTNPPDVVTDDNIVDEIITPETDAPEEEVVETDAPEEEVVETEAPEEEVVETEAPEEEVVETEAPEEEVVEEAGQRGPGGERPREDDPDCEDWTYGC